MAKTLLMANNANEKFNRSETLAQHKVSKTNMEMENRIEFNKRHKQTNDISRQYTVSLDCRITIATNYQSKYEFKPKLRSNSNSGCRINCVKNQRFHGLTNQHFWWLMVMWLMAFQMPRHVASNQGTATTTTSLSAIRYSQLLSTNGQMTMNDDNMSTANDDDTFRPFVPKDPEMLTHNVFTPSGQFRVFQPIDTDLRTAAALQSKSQQNGKNELSHSLSTATVSTPFSSHVQRAESRIEDQSRKHKTTEAHTTLQHTDKQPETSNLLQQQQQQHNQLNTIKKSENSVKQRNDIRKQDMLLDADADDTNVDITTDFKNLEDLLVDYVSNMWEKGQYEPVPGLVVELQNLNHTEAMQSTVTQDKTRTVRQAKQGVTDAKVHIDVPRTLATGRLLFLTGLKKVLWPVFMGLQVLKSLLIAMFIPAIIGSFTKLLGKGISTGSAPLFIRPMEPPQELDFRDNSINFDDDNKFLVNDDGLKDNSPYAYNQPDASQMHNEYVFDPASANNQLTFTRLGMNERQHQLMQDSYMSALQSIGSASFKNSGSLSSGSSGLLAPMAKKPPPAANVNTFQQFQKVPDSSLLLSNYDPFYSPLLSRLDSVFAQLKINSDKEICREKVICLMYANPAKYAPYSNLVSAQLSRELNELRKPTSDNPDILRFFKYMRAAKDGQDGVDCEQTFDKCTEFKDYENPAMLSTYHDINKLVQARKLTKK
ncbi:hypothetical protein DOY81_003392 [Sarcophaga bullata]|nr:hypothetical protein DOY81_003392 [Sarcophaga bullata]